MNIKFQDEYVCDVCKCSYIKRNNGLKNRCEAHENLPGVVENEVKWLHKDISSAALADRITVLERQVKTLSEPAKDKGFSKVCEDCKESFIAYSPAVKKCDRCKAVKLNTGA